MRFLLLSLLLTSTSLWAQDQVYFAHTSLDGPEHPFCVSWANAALPDSEVSYRGQGESSYSCKIDFSYRERLGDWDYSKEEKLASHSIQYNSLSKRQQRTQTLRSTLQGGFGYLIREEKNGKLSVRILGEGIEKLFPNLTFLNDHFSIEMKDKMLELKPSFKSLISAQQLACQVVALELLSLACPESKDALREDIRTRLMSVFHWERMREGLIPRTGSRHP